MYRSLRFATLLALTVFVAGCGSMSKPVPVGHPPLESSITPEGARPEAPPTLRLQAPYGVVPKHIDDAGLALIERFENVYKARYCVEYDAYGHTYDIGFGEAFINPNRACESFAQAQANLRYQVETNYEWAVRALGINYDQHEWDALCSFTYNLGAGIWTGALRYAIQHFDPYPMLGFDHAGGVVLPGLAERRRLEVHLFLEPEPHPTPPRPKPVSHVQRLRELHSAEARLKGLELQQRHLRTKLAKFGCRRLEHEHRRRGPRCRGWEAAGGRVGAHGRAELATIHRLRRLV